MNEIFENWLVEQPASQVFNDLHILKILYYLRILASCSSYMCTAAAYRRL